MLNKNIKNSVKVCFKEMPMHFMFMIILNLVFALLPILGMMITIELYSSLVDSTVTMEEITNILLIFFAYNLILKCYLLWYKRVVVQMNNIPKFEKVVKDKIQIKCNKLEVENYEDSNFYNNIWSASVAGTNIYRITEFVIDALSIVISIILLTMYLSLFSYILVVFILISSIPPLIERIIEGKLVKKVRKKEIENIKLEKYWHDTVKDINGYKDLKVNNGFETIHEKQKEVINELIDLKYKNNKKVLFLKVILDFVTVVSKFSVYAIAVYLFYKSVITFSVFMAAISAFTVLEHKYRELFEGFGYFNRFVSLVKPYFDFLEQRTDNVDKEKFESISLKGVNYKYKTSKDLVLKDITIDIKKGQKVAIIGINGAGKSTLAKVLLGFLKYSENNVKEYNNISALMQDYCKYEGTLSENITFSKEKGDDSLRRVGLEELEKYYDQEIGLMFSDIDFSGGQWQRIALARAIHKESDFMVLDEPSSAIDPLKEKLLNNLIAKLDKTLVIITHRLSIARDVDKIYIMSEGKIICNGTHSSLLEDNKLYKELWDSQKLI